MRFVARPSKQFLFDRLESHLKHFSGSVGLDVGSADFKNRYMVKTGKYYGLDRRLPLIQKGLARYSGPDTIGILADFTQLDALRSNSVDVVVSTNALHQLDPESRKQGLAHLCRLTVPTGYLFVEVSIGQDFDALNRIVRGTFKAIKVRYYKNALSQAYESIFERDGNLGSSSRILRLMSWGISRFEYLTQFTRFGNQHAFIVATGKSGERQDLEFDVANPPRFDSIESRRARFDSRLSARRADSRIIKLSP